MTRIAFDDARRRPLYTSRRANWWRKLGQFLLGVVLVWSGLGLPGLSHI